MIVLDKLFKWGICLFLIVGIFTGNINNMMNKMIDTPKQVYDLVLTLILSACLWGGFLNVIEESHYIDLFKPVLTPVLRLIYGNIVNDSHIFNSLAVNIIANLIGLGTLSTISGIQAFKYIYNIKNKVCREMMTLVLINGSGLSLFPMSLIMLRKEMNSVRLYEFYPYMIMISVSVLIIGLFIQRIIDDE